ncbi:unnamed protein product, partial [marine sediment metagenome]
QIALSSQPRPSLMLFLTSDILQDVVTIAIDNLGFAYLSHSLASVRIDEMLVTVDKIAGLTTND